MMFFKPEDFEYCENRFYMRKKKDCDELATLTNHLLEERAKKMYRERNGEWKDFKECLGPWDEALLIELPKRDCEHEPQWGLHPRMDAIHNNRCKHCGTRLKAKWEVCE